MRYTKGPRTSAITMAPSTSAPAMASRCRRKRRQPSPASVRPAGASGIGDARVQPAVEHVGHDVEGDDEHGVDEGDGEDDRRIAGQDGRDEQGADARHAKDLL